ncbi:DUF58 domain-containing protein [Ovoidimarina sediminis]|uniref:DUF58 domain-containing protein n=1 Tax=Ovoidimarina sediminis TaxID=3079856 RepID=UPI00290D5560|nr:DUF58 domain-containing protein [Rhodophyticola sp. MJ-SS7]MDU8943690.1 DUF58 domain-containing protein [Rhodophyticola sp. MJ-SS7]
MITPADLRARAEALAGPLPPLLAAAEHLATTVLLGEHGRRRPGMGDEFWQYRPAQAGDEMRMVDWRRSARSDIHFVREKEWQAAQSVVIWVDRGQSMQFASSDTLQTKSLVARTIALATAVLLTRGGERVGLADNSLPPRSGELQLLRLAEALSQDDETTEYGAPETRGMIAHSRAVFLSDFLGDISPARAALTKAADKGVKGALVQVLDPAEEAFPYDGRTIFESVGGTIRFETQKARDLRDRYLDRLAERKEELRSLARLTGWQYEVHHTDHSATAALLWLYQAMDRVH